jgi:Major tropism determinant N-terminal domain
MAIVQISRIQQRRGLEQDLPQLAAGEFGWSTDSNRLYIGNGSLEEGSPLPGQNTEILTQYSVVSLSNTFLANLAVLASQVASLTTITASLSNQTGQNSSQILAPGSSGSIAPVTANNAIITYTLSQGTKQRSGTISLSRWFAGAPISYTEEYNETATTDVTFSISSNSTQASFDYATTTVTSLLYNIKALN